MQQVIKQPRIESIDALRAFALFGILLVHISQLYNFDNDFNDFTWFTATGKNIQHHIRSIFMGRCRNIFCILFGVSFYLILRNPNYTIKKFCWRCFLLMGFGFIDKIFFSTDILWWYGLNGIILAILPIRNLKNKYILLFSILLFIYSIIPIPNWDDIFFHEYNYNNRYISTHSILDYLQYSYITVFKEQIHLFMGGSTETLSFFIFGYFLGKSGTIEEIDNLASYKNITICLFLFIPAWFLYHKSNSQIFQTISILLGVFTGAITYSLIFIFFFNKFKYILFPLICYGRLGLTNYSLQNIICPILLLTILFPLHLSFEYILLTAIAFYSLQILFSFWWIKNFKYGPLEYIWRMATQLEYINNKKTSRPCIKTKKH